MKFVITACFCALLVSAQQPSVPQPSAPLPNGLVPVLSEPVERRLPADILRDFPGQCFASTACRVFPVNETWPLFPFCGVAACLEEDAGTKDAQLIEVVQDCGPRPKDLNGCIPDERVNPEAPFPACCPMYLCEPGKKPVQFTPEELRTLAAEGPQGAGNPQQRQQQTQRGQQAQTAKPSA